MPAYGMTNDWYFLYPRYRFKDGKPYPFPGLILYPEEANQTIYTRDATMAVAGNYTCVLRNDTHKMEHHVELIVKGGFPYQSKLRKL